MNYQLYSKNVIVTDSLKNYIQSKLEHVESHSSHIVSCRIDLSRDQKHHKGEIFRFEINLNVPGKLLRTVEHHEDMRAAVDLAVDKLVRQLQKYKERRLSDRRRVSKVLSRLFRRDKYLE